MLPRTMAECDRTGACPGVLCFTSSYRDGDGLDRVLLTCDRCGRHETRAWDEAPAMAAPTRGEPWP